MKKLILALSIVLLAQSAYATPKEDYCANRASQAEDFMNLRLNGYSKEKLRDEVFDYSIKNDVTARDLQLAYITIEKIYDMPRTSASNAYVRVYNNCLVVMGN